MEARLQHQSTLAVYFKVRIEIKLSCTNWIVDRPTVRLSVANLLSVASGHCGPVDPITDFDEYCKTIQLPYRNPKSKGKRR